MRRSPAVRLAAEGLAVDFVAISTHLPRQFRDKVRPDQGGGLLRWATADGHSSSYDHAVGFYEDQVFPRLTNVMLGNKAFGQLRREVCEGLHGDVVELGFGSGLNLPWLPAAVTGVWAIEPSGTATRLAQKRIVSAPVAVHVAGLDGAHLDLPDERFDSALSTMTLCTIPDVRGALKQLARVLKPGGSFHFADHGHSPEPKVARTQERFNGFQQWWARGCHLNRDIAELITDAGFEIEQLRNFYLKGPKAVGYIYLGRARNGPAG